MLLILFHNYSHIIKPWAGENEFVFSAQYIHSFLFILKEEPLDFIRLLFAFFGHYGVQLFIFISGYGLFLSYKNKHVKWYSFFKKHILKLYPAYILAIALFLILFPIQYHKFPPPWVFKFAIADLLFIQNFIPEWVFKLVGPWWFFSLIVQLYAIFPLVLMLFRRFGIKAIVVTGIFSWFIVLLFNPWLVNKGYNLYYLFLGRLPVFCLGILFAYLAEFKLSWWLIGFSFILMLAGNLSSALWPFTMLAVTLFLLVTIRLIIPVIQSRRTISSFLSWIGVNSLFIFAVHGALRWPFVNKAAQMDAPLITIGLGLMFLIVSLIAALLIKKIENGVQEKLVHRYLYRY